MNTTFGPKLIAINDYAVQSGWTTFDKYPRQVADVNGDGRADIIAFGDTGVSVSLGKSNGTFGTKFKAINDYAVQGSWTTFNKYPRQVADVNGDGRADIIAFGGNAIYVSLGQLNGTFGKAFKAINEYGVQNGWTTFDKYPRQVADVNGDGRADIIAFGDTGVSVSLGQSNGTFGTKFKAINDYAVQGSWTTFNKYPRQVADVNGDGRADIIAFGGSSTYVSLGKLNGTFGQAFKAINHYTVNAGGWTTFDQYPRQIADVNGDGRADIIGFGYDGVSVSLGQSNGTFATGSIAINDYAVQSGWTTFDKYPRQVADVNGDDLADIVAFGDTGVSVSLGQSNLIVGGYLGNWNINGNTDPNTIPANKLTHLFYAFANVANNGTVSNPGNGDDIPVLQGLKTQNPNLKTILSIGGGGGDALAQTFANVAANAQSRETFANTAVAYMKNNGFNGIDVDWEFPKKGETNNFIALLDTLKAKLDTASTADGKKYLLTIAASASPYFLTPNDYASDPYEGFTSQQIAQIVKDVDFINVMTYDYSGPWDSRTNHQAPLYKSTNDNGYNAQKLNLDWAVNYYKQAGVPSKEIIAGIPLYGYKKGGVSNTNNGLFQNGTDNGAATYKDLYNLVSDTSRDYQVFMDNSAKVPYIYSKNEQIFSTYENPQSVRTKADYVKNNQLGGVFFWEITQDLNSSSSDSLINNTVNQLVI